MPIRMSHGRCVFYFISNLRGHRLDPSFLTSRKVDVLKQFRVPCQQAPNLPLSIKCEPKVRIVIEMESIIKGRIGKKGANRGCFASGKGIYVTMKGMAMDDGVEGGIVRIKNISSDKEFQAKVLNENSVKVHL